MGTDDKMIFRRYGRSCHLQIETAADLRLAERLDESHWAATNAPTSTINCDSTFLQLLDVDNNVRIMCFEVKVAIRWLFDVLRDHRGVTESSRTLRLEAINTKTDEGRRIHNAAAKMLSRLDKPEAKEITLAEIRQIKAEVESMPVSEAGVVLPEAADEADIRQFILDGIAAVGGAPHPSGAQGLGRAQLEAFIEGAKAYLQWHGQGEIPSDSDKTGIMPLGAETPGVYGVLASLRGKIDQYFAQCEALALDERLAGRMGWQDEELGGLDLDDPATIQEVLKKAPIATARPAGVLTFADRVNPFYADLLERFRRDVAERVLGGDKEALSADDWGRIKSVFAGHHEWAAAKPAAALESLGVERLGEYLEERFADAVGALIANSIKTAFDLNNIRLAEKLLLYQGYLLDLANNFVSFPHLYDASRRAMFEMGALVADGRVFNLTVRVENRARHAELARTSNMYVLYVEVTDKEQKKYEIASPVTSGGKGNLCVGKRGLFHDISGAEHDAVVVQVIENPISVREAMLSPFVRLGKLITGKIESLTTRAEKKLDAQAAATIKQAPAQKGGMPSGGMLMGIGVATAALGSALAYITKTFSETNVWAIVAGIAAAILAVLLPTSIVAVMKLRRRDLSAILEGAGWGINARMRLTGRLGRFFTQRPKYPKGSKGTSRITWPVALVILLVVAVLIGGGYILRRMQGSPKTPTTQPTPGAATSAK
ncbi:MAG: hypothetical protein QF577_04435 [Phycisphaerae bacterium]|jgi:hypothetical protein|nr:hypothetical protein [Phycisphaerae bacterium]MDP7636781.1 hypothetical protein [Phycisphaerae bacterium]